MSPKATRRPLGDVATALGARAAGRFLRGPAGALRPVVIWTDGADPIDDPDELSDIVCDPALKLGGATTDQVPRALGAYEGGRLFALTGPPLGATEVEVFLLPAGGRPVWAHWVRAHSA